MKHFDKNTKMAIQGDVAITSLGSLPDGLDIAESENDTYVIAHSETGHHHAVAVEKTQMYNDPNNEFVAFLVVEEDGVELKHDRSYDTHETINFDAGVYRINRQREYTPEGFRRAAD